MRIQVQSDADAAATAGARVIADQAREAIAARGRFAMAVSGGHVLWQMFRDPGQRNNAVEGRACHAGGRATGAAGRPGPQSDTPARKFAFTSAVAVRAIPRDAGGGK